MPIAIISDIHGNLDALQAVLADIEAHRIDRIFCLGDNIGYGPEPEGVIDLLCRRRIPSVIGNHELAATDQKHLSWFNPAARRSLLQTIQMLSGEALDYAAGLPTSRVEAGIRLVHGFPPDSSLTYLFQASEQKIIRTFRKSREKVCFVGHTHDLELVSFDGQQLFLDRLKPGPLDLDPDRKHIVNVGSVGQPRDGDNRAKYVVWSPEDHVLDVRSVAYDIEAAAKKILAAGMPRSHAMRLF